MQQWFQTWQKEMRAKLDDYETSTNNHYLVRKYKTPPEILPELNFKIFKIQPVRAALKLFTNKGILALKKTGMSHARLTFITEGASYVHHNGFDKVVEYVPFRNGSFFFSAGNKTYVITKWIEGKESDMSDPRQEYQGAVTMAQFHKASYGFRSSISLNHVSRLGFLEYDLEQYVQEFSQFSLAADKRHHPGKIEELIKKYNGLFQYKSQESLSMLKSMGYHDYIQRGYHTFALLHQDFAYHNLIWRNQEIHLIDLDYLTWDLRCIDLSKYLRRNLRLSNWKTKTAENIINGYTSITPLDRKELEIIYILLYFPYKYWQILHLYYLDGKKYRPKKVYDTVKELVDQQSNKDLFLKDFAKYYL